MIKLKFIIKVMTYFSIIWYMLHLNLISSLYPLFSDTYAKKIFFDKDIKFADMITQSQRIKLCNCVLQGCFHDQNQLLSDILLIFGGFFSYKKYLIFKL